MNSRRRSSWTESHLYQWYEFKRHKSSILQQEDQRLLDKVCPDRKMGINPRGQFSLPCYRASIAFHQVEPHSCPTMTSLTAKYGVIPSVTMNLLTDLSMDINESWGLTTHFMYLDKCNIKHVTSGSNFALVLQLLVFLRNLVGDTTCSPTVSNMACIVVIEELWKWNKWNSMKSKSTSKTRTSFNMIVESNSTIKMIGNITKQQDHFMLIVKVDNEQCFMPTSHRTQLRWLVYLWSNMTQWPRVMIMYTSILASDSFN